MFDSGIFSFMILVLIGLILYVVAIALRVRGFSKRQQLAKQREELNRIAELEGMRLNLPKSLPDLDAERPVPTPWGYIGTTSRASNVDRKSDSDAEG